MSSGRIPAMTAVTPSISPRARVGGEHGVPRVSVLLPCRDAAEHLPAAVDSLASQTFRDFEVIAIDDGSRDATPDHLAGWASRDPRVHLVRSDPRGIVPALRDALRLASGEIVARMDADDIAEPTRLERQLDLLDARPEIAACGVGVRYFPRPAVRDGALRYERWLNSLTEPDELARDIFVECPIAHPALMVRREVLLSVGGYCDMGWPEDYDLILRLWATGHGLANVGEVLLLWRESMGRASRTDPRYSADAFRRCKVQFLRQTLLNDRDGAVVCGAGPTGKAFARELQRQGVEVLAFVDLDPRKIGQQIHGAPVIGADEVHRYRGALGFAAVGSEGARSRIRAMLTGSGWEEGRDFVAVA